MRKNIPSQRTSSQRSGQEPTDKTERVLNLPNQTNTRKKQSRPSRKRRSLRTGAAVIAGRAAGALSRRLHIGGGTSIVGMTAQRIDPNIIAHLAAQLEHGCLLVTGTNGKTTTSSFIAAILQDSGLRVWRNREGSNLLRGIATSLVIRALPSGKLRRSGNAISILEVDEATLPQLVQNVSPRVTIFTNLFRDQLDRYGEVESVIAYWKQAIKNLPETSTLVLNADDPAVASLGEAFTGRTLYYGIEDLAFDGHTMPDTKERLQIVDTRICPHCGSDYTYDVRFYSHMGHYHCQNCGNKRPHPDIRATHIHVDTFDRLRLQITTDAQQHEMVVPLPGFYNIYNALAATAGALAVGMPWEPVISGIEQFKPVFGRGERIQAEGRSLRLLLAKNPTSFNEVIHTLFSEGTPRHLLLVLNDNAADGRDISWIWDVDFERIAGYTKTLIVAGTRALDLAIRLKYAGIEEENMTIIPHTPLRATRLASIRRTRSKRAAQAAQQEEPPLEKMGSTNHSVRPHGLATALTTAIQQTPEGETLFVVPTYTGLLAVHRELESRGLASRYWEEKDA
jgi:UDP-N-acetylmuramyl tripeptide synthase